jgi:hypothetical protein
MQSSDIRCLNRLADFVNKFDSPYLCLFNKQKLVTPSAPQPRRPRQPHIDDRYITAELSRLAHEATQFGLVYRVPSRSRFPGHSQSTGHDTSPNFIDRSSLMELNRMARLFELCDNASIYPQYRPESELFRSRLQPLERIRLNQLVRKLKLDHSSEFSRSFPSTRKPIVAYFSGQPRIEKTVFNDLLKSKLHELRSLLGVPSTPTGASAFVVSRINMLLSKLKAPPKGKSSSEKTTPAPNKANPKPKGKGPAVSKENKTPAPIAFVHPVMMETKSQRRKAVILGPKDTDFESMPSPSLARPPSPVTVPDDVNLVSPEIVELSSIVPGSPEHLRFISEITRSVRVTFAKHVIDPAVDVRQALQEYMRRVFLIDVFPIDSGTVRGPTLTPRNSGTVQFSFLTLRDVLRISKSPTPRDNASWTDWYLTECYQIVQNYHQAIKGF